MIKWVKHKQKNSETYKGYDNSACSLYSIKLQGNKYLLLCAHDSAFAELCDSVETAKLLASIHNAEHV